MSRMKLRHIEKPGTVGMAWCGKYIGRRNEYNAPEGKPICKRCDQTIQADQRRQSKEVVKLQQWEKEPRSLIVLRIGDKILARFKSLDCYCLNEAVRLAKYFSNRDFVYREVNFWRQPCDFRWESNGEIESRIFRMGVEC